MLILFTDTDTDMTPAKAAEYGYHLVSMPYSIDGKNVFPYEDFETFEPKPFYDRLRNGTLPKTSGLSEEKYKEYFEPHFAAGNDILYAHFSRSMSMTFDTMDKAVAELLAKYPERRFYTVDTKAISSLSYNVLCEIGDLYKAGATAEEILAWAEREVDRFAMYFFTDTLDFFHRSGRVGGISAAMGSLLGIRPIIHINDEGKMVSIGKAKGRAKAIDSLVSYMEELGDDIENHRVIIGTSDADDMVEVLLEAIHEKFGNRLQLEIVTVNPTGGSHCGPDGIGVSFHAKHR